MSIIGDAKARLARAIEQELGEIRAALDVAAARMNEAAEDAAGLNGLSSDLRAFALAISVEAEKVTAASDKSVGKLGLTHAPITQTVNKDLVARLEGGRQIDASNLRVGA